VKLVQQSLDERFVRRLPRRLIADKAYDSAPLEEELRRKGIKLIAPVRDSGTIRRKRKRRVDGRLLRRYRKRWRIERLFSWLFQCRRLVTRWEPKAENFLGFLQLGCIRILLRRL